jgi:hypothetical protein
VGRTPDGKKIAADRAVNDVHVITNFDNCNEVDYGSRF